MTNSPAGGPGPSVTPPPAGALLTDDQIRWVRRSVVVMTALLIIGIAVLIGRVIYLARAGGTQAASVAGMTVALPAALLAESRLALPPGAELKAMSLSGHLLAVEAVEPAAGSVVLVLDLTTGKVVSRVRITRGP